MDTVTIPIRWSEDQPAPQPSNQFVVQRTPAEEILLTLGYVSAPIIVGTQEEQQQRFELIAERGIEVRSAGQFVLSLKTARELHQALTAQGVAEGS